MTPPTLQLLPTKLRRVANCVPSLIFAQGSIFCHPWRFPQTESWMTLLAFPMRPFLLLWSSLRGCTSQGFSALGCSGFAESHWSSPMLTFSCHHGCRGCFHESCGIPPNNMFQNDPAKLDGIARPLVTKHCLFRISFEHHVKRPKLLVEHSRKPLITISWYFLPCFDLCQDFVSHLLAYWVWFQPLYTLNTQGFFIAQMCLLSFNSLYWGWESHPTFHQ